MKIIVTTLSDTEIAEKGIKKWPVWNKEISKFDWFYDTTEHCLILEGRVIVETSSEKIELKAGDFVTFPSGLSCKWDIKENIKKHYNFE